MPVSIACAKMLKNKAFINTIGVDTAETGPIETAGGAVCVPIRPKSTEAEKPERHSAGQASQLALELAVQPALQLALQQQAA